MVPIDTRLDVRANGVSGPREVESLIARMDVVVTTRLHGMVLALKHGVPVLAVDPIAGGAKVCRQAEAIRWPIIFTTDSLADDALEGAFDWCPSEEARHEAWACGRAAAERIEEVRAAVKAEFASTTR